MAVPLPDRATLDAAQQRAEKERAFWNAHRTELTKAHPDEFIAIQNGEVVGHDLDLLVLAARLQDVGIPMTEVTIEFAATKTELHLL